MYTEGQGEPHVCSHGLKADAKCGGLDDTGKFGFPTAQGNGRLGDGPMPEGMPAHSENTAAGAAASSLTSREIRIRENIYGVTPQPQS